MSVLHGTSTLVGITILYNIVVYYWRLWGSWFLDGSEADHPVNGTYCSLTTKFALADEKRWTSEASHNVCFTLLHFGILDQFSSVSQHSLLFSKFGAAIERSDLLWHLTLHGTFVAVPGARKAITRRQCCCSRKSLIILTLCLIKFRKDS